MVHYSQRPAEGLTCAFLAQRNRLIAIEDLFHGTTNSASVHPREIVRRCIELNAAALVLAHNHPFAVDHLSVSLSWRRTPMKLLRIRIEKLERRPMSHSLHYLPAETLQRRLDLLLRIHVYCLVGRDASEPRRELEALGPLRLPQQSKSEPSDDASIRQMALDTLRAEPEWADYRELLAMMEAGSAC